MRRQSYKCALIDFLSRIHSWFAVQPASARCMFHDYERRKQWNAAHHDLHAECSQKMIQIIAIKACKLSWIARRDRVRESRETEKRKRERESDKKKHVVIIIHFHLNMMCEPVSARAHTTVLGNALLFFPRYNELFLLLQQLSGVFLADNNNNNLHNNKEIRTILWYFVCM